MKLFIVLSLIACSHAAKLDRTYLPPSSAASAGGSPGSLTAPFGSAVDAGSQQPGLGSQYQPSGSEQGTDGLTQQPSAGFGRPATASRFGESTSQASGGFGSLRPSSQSGSGVSSFVGAGQSATPSADNRFGSSPTRPTGPAGFGQSASPSGASEQSGYGSGPQSGFDGASQYEQSSGAPGFGPSQQAFGQTGFGQSSAAANQVQAASAFNQGPSAYNQDRASQPERPQAASDRNAETLRYDSENDGQTFAYSFETSNAITAEESGVATNGVQAQGAFAYTGDDGQRYSVTYTADERGYLPQGDHLPTSPPIPDEILRSIEENARAAAAGTQEGAYNPEEDVSDAPQQYNSGAAPAFQPQVPNRFGGPDGDDSEPASPEEPAQEYNKVQPQRFGPTNGYAPSRPVGTNGSPQQYRPQAQGPRQQIAKPNGNAPALGTPQGAPYQYNRPQATKPASQFSVSNGNDVAASLEPQTQEYSRPQGSAPAPGTPQGAPYQYNRPQATKPTSQFSVSTGNELAASLEPQTQEYSRPQGFGPVSVNNRNSVASISQEPAKQFNRPQTTTQTRVPTQQFGAPNGNAAPETARPQGVQQYNKPQAPIGQSGKGNKGYPAPSGVLSQNADDSYQYNKPQNAGPFAKVNGGNTPRPFDQRPQGNGQLSGIQNQRPNGSPLKPFSQKPQANNRPQFNQPQQGSGTENAEESGYDYSAPQGTPFVSGNQGRPQPARPQFNRPESQQNTGSQPSRPQQFNRPESPRPQPQGFRPQGSDVAAVANRGSFGQNQVSGQYQPGARAPMPQSAPYEYNRPSASQESQPGSQKPLRQPQGQTFGGPRQPPSFDPEEGYKY